MSELIPPFDPLLNELPPMSLTTQCVLLGHLKNGNVISPVGCGVVQFTSAHPDCANTAKIASMGSTAQNKDIISMHVVKDRGFYFIQYQRNILYEQYVD